MRYAAKTDLGLVRRNNEDALFAQDTPIGPVDALFMVADGMGGYEGGEYASSFVVQKVSELLAEKQADGNIRQLLIDVTDKANAELYRIAQNTEGYRGMGTTLVLAAFAGKTLHIINVGDSRLYKLPPDGPMVQITKDHSLVEELVATGRLSRGDYLYETNKNIITRAMGIEPFVEQDYFCAETEPGSRFMLCSDGLSGELSDERLEAILKEQTSVEDAAELMIEESKQAGGGDNISVIIIET